MDKALRRGVRARLDPELVRESIAALTTRAPTDRIRATERGWEVHDEVPWFVLFFAVALLALALIAHAGTARAPGFPRTFRVIPWLLDLGCLASGYLFARRLWGSMSIALEGDALVIERTFRGKTVSVARLDPEEIQAVRVLEDRVVSIEGPRNQTLATVFRAGLLDSPALARWIADSVVALCERALER
jgi:hypothetical protein